MILSHINRFIWVASALPGIWFEFLSSLSPTAGASPPPSVRDVSTGSSRSGTTWVKRRAGRGGERRGGVGREEGRKEIEQGGRKEGESDESKDREQVSVF
jgi:hypothetical protein